MPGTPIEVVNWLTRSLRHNDTILYFHSVVRPIALERCNGDCSSTSKSTLGAGIRLPGLPTDAAKHAAPAHHFRFGSNHEELRVSKRPLGHPLNADVAQYHRHFAFAP